MQKVVSASRGKIKNSLWQGKLCRVVDKAVQRAVSAAEHQGVRIGNARQKSAVIRNFCHVGKAAFAAFQKRLNLFAILCAASVSRKGVKKNMVDHVTLPFRSFSKAHIVYHILNIFATVSTISC